MVIVSHGPNGAGAFSTQQNARVAAINAADLDEIANAPGGPAAQINILLLNGTPPPAYVIKGAPALVIRDTNTSTDQAQNFGGIFDDIVLVLRREDFTVPLTKSGLMQPVESQVAAGLQQAQTELIGYLRAHLTANPCTPPGNCTPLPNVIALPPTTCTGSPCTLPVTTAVDPCSSSNPPARLSYQIVYDINYPACGGPTVTTATTLVSNLTAPGIAYTPVPASCSGTSVGGGGVVISSTCAIPNNTIIFSQSFLGGIQ